MSIKKLCAHIGVMAIVTCLLSSPKAAAQSESVLLSFSGANGNGPQSGLIAGRGGVFFGTTEDGGIYNDGTVFEFGHTATGWTEKVLHNFGSTTEDGALPVGGLVTDSAGNLYGTTTKGGVYGDGAVFELVRRSGGGWVERVLHSFNSNNTAEGNSPYGGLILDSGGNLYGTCYYGGHKNYGTVFELLPATGTWKEKTLGSFSGLNGWGPFGSLVFDEAGNLYGTTAKGGAADYYGTVFKLAPGAAGAWTISTLYSFDNYDGTSPEGTLVFDSAGNLYGTTALGGSCCGYVFELSPSAAGMWNYTALLEFSGGTTGGFPGPALIFDKAGNLYGTASNGGEGYGGVVFELSPSAGGTWSQIILHNFPTNDQDGNGPTGALVMDSFGNLYGTTGAGGTSDMGTVYEITP